jgi:hypothetical protein
MSDRPTEELLAGDEFRHSLHYRADAWHHNAPLWHGWAIMDAFLAGIDYARRESVQAARTAPKAEQATHTPDPSD